MADETDFPFQHFVAEDKKKQNKGSYLFAEDSHLRFIGSSHEEFNLSKNNFNYAIGYYQPTSKNKKVKLVQAHGVFNMRQVQLGTGEIDDGSKREIDFAAVRKDLTEQFGSRKRKRQLRSEEAGRVNIEADEAALQALHTQLQVIEQQPSHLEDLDKTGQGKLETINRILPKYDAETKTPAEIYKFSDIFPKALWDALDAPKMLCLCLTANNNATVVIKKKKTSQKLMDDDSETSSDEDDSSDDDSSSDSEEEGGEKKKKDVEQGEVKNVYSALTPEEKQRVAELPQFIQNKRAKLLPIILSAQTTGSAQQQAFVKQRVVQLAYLNIVFRLIKLEKNRKVQKSKDEFQTYIMAPQTSPNTSVVNQIKQHFFKVNGPTIANAYNSEAKFRVLSHLCILSLICADGFEMGKGDVATIANDLQMPASQLLSIYKTVGCTNASESNCKLKAPLKLDLGGNQSARSR